MSLNFVKSENMLKPGEHVEQEQREDGLHHGHAHLVMLSGSLAGFLQPCKSEACSPAVPRIVPGNATLWLKVPVCYPARAGFPRHPPGVVRSSAVAAGLRSRQPRLFPQALYRPAR